MTPKQELLEIRYGGDLAADISAWLTSGKSWRQIRHDVETATGLHISHESLRSWYGTDRIAA